MTRLVASPVLSRPRRRAAAPPPAPPRTAAPRDTLTGDDRACVEALRSGDEDVLAVLVDRHTPGMTRLARCLVQDDGLADQVVTATWMTAFRALDRYRGPSLRLWLFGMLAETATVRGAMAGSERAPHRVRPAGLHPAGSWRQAPARWGPEAVARLGAPDTRAVVERAVADLPPSQRVAVTLRDVEGWSAEEVRLLLGIGAGELRGLLQAGRTAVRDALDAHLAGTAARAA
jgi:RNA polymerase sigma-70 factor, ECF subfamily